MESLSDTEWDVLISGTGLQQSLLALALSRSDKKILHVDENEYYGGPDAAFSLQEVDEWVKQVESPTSPTPFSKASVQRPVDVGDQSTGQLSFSRAYTLSLSPQIIYSKSKLLGQLVSSKVYKQLEFQAVGNWWIFRHSDADASDDSRGASNLRRLPNGREDIFSDRSIDVRAKRGLVKFLKFAVDYETHADTWKSHADESLPDFLSSQFQLPPSLQTYITALTLSLESPSKTTVGYALPRIARHLTSIGVFGPGFGAVIPKWGGGSEIAQVACRACAVGGGVYILGTGITSSKSGESGTVDVTLSNGEKINSKLVLPAEMSSASEVDRTSVAKSVVIVASSLDLLFTTTVEGAPVAAVSVVAFPSGYLCDITTAPFDEPVYVFVHSSETGECPVGQCVLYATTMDTNNAQGRLDLAITTLLSSVDPTTEFATDQQKLYSLNYVQQASSKPSFTGTDLDTFKFSWPSSDLAFDDRMLSGVEAAWNVVLRRTSTVEDVTPTPFLVFEDRKGMGEGDEDEEDELQ